MLLACSLLAVAGGSGTAATLEDLSAIDRDLARLRADLEAKDGIAISALLRTSYSNSGDILIDLNGNGVQDPGENDLGGFTLDNVRLMLDGKVGDFDVHLSTEAASAFNNLTGNFPVGVLDAWAATALGERARFTMGQYQPPLLHGALIDPGRMLFILRTTDDEFWNLRDQGAMLDGAFNQLHWALAVQNGLADGAGDDLAFTGRLDFDLAGGGAGKVNEGALGAPDGFAATIGVGYHDDEGATGDGGVLAVDAFATLGRFAASLEWLDYDDDGGAGAGIYSVFSDTTPISAALSFMLVPEKYEAAVRWQDVDDSFNTQAITLGVNRYIEGHDMKVQLNYIDKSADSPAVDAQVIALGVTVRI